MLPCLVCSFTTATNRTITSSEDGTTSTKASQSRACDNNFTAYKDLKGRGRDLSADGGVLRDDPRLLPNLRPPLFRRLDNRRSASSRQNAFLYLFIPLFFKSSKACSVGRTPFKKHTFVDLHHSGNLRLAPNG